MSAAERLVTRDGAGWTLRGLNAAGEGLYAPDAVSDCPQQLLVTAADLAQHGVRVLLGTETAAEPEVSAQRDPGACEACGDLPEQWCPDCGACKAGCHGGHDGNPCTHANASWGGAS